MPASAEFQRRLATIEELLLKVEAASDPNLRASVKELVELVMGLHGEGLDRMMELIHASDDDLARKLGRDELVGSILVLHGLHPLKLEERVAQALDKVSGRVHRDGGEIDVLSLQDGAVRLQLRMTGHSCGSTGQALKTAIEDAVYQAAPDLSSLVIEDEPQKAGFVSVDFLRESLGVL